MKKLSTCVQPVTLFQTGKIAAASRLCWERRSF